MTDDLARDLARAFDASFALPARPAAAPAIDVLGITTGGGAFALRAHDLAAIATDRPLVPVPSSAPGLLGVASVRTAVVPVFSLAMLLGLPAGEAPRWLAVCRAPEPVAFAFHRLDGHWRVLPAAILAAQGGALAPERVDLDGGARPLLSVPRLLAAIRGHRPSGD